MTPSLVRFSRGFLCGSMVGTALLTIGLVGWAIALITGFDNDVSTHGIALFPVFVLSFGFGGSVIGLFRADRFKSIKSLFAWVFAVAIVLTGCFFIASFVESREPIGAAWGVSSGYALAAMMTFTVATSKWNKQSFAETKAADETQNQNGTPL